ncbi:MAG: hypothetical protein ABIC95_03465 [archaeon]
MSIPNHVRNRIMLALLLALTLSATVAVALELKMPDIKMPKSEWLVKGVNFLVAFTILALLQAGFTVTQKQKPGKELISLIGITSALGAALVAFLLVKDGYLWSSILWQDLMQWKVWGNFISSAAFLFTLKFVVLDRLLDAKMKEVGAAGIVLVILFIAGFAAYMPYMGTDYHWEKDKGESYQMWWDFEMIRGPRMFLLGDGDCYDLGRWGIKEKTSERTVFIANNGKEYSLLNGKWYNGKKSMTSVASKDEVETELAKRIGMQVTFYNNVQTAEGNLEKLETEAEAYVKNLITKAPSTLGGGTRCYSDLSYKRIEENTPKEERYSYLTTQDNPKRGFGIARGRFLIIVLAGYGIIFFFYKKVLFKTLEEKSVLIKLFAGFTAIMIAISGLPNKWVINLLLYMFIATTIYIYWNNPKSDGAKKGAWMGKVIMVVIFYLFLTNIANFAFPGDVMGVWFIESPIDRPATDSEMAIASVWTPKWMGDPYSPSTGNEMQTNLAVNQKSNQAGNPRT